MLINIVKLNGTTELRQIQMGQMLTGLRITSIVLESPEEVMAMTKEENRLYIIRHMASRFRPRNKDGTYE